MLPVQVLVTAKENFPPSSFPPLGKLQFSTYSPPCHNSTSISTSRSPGGCESAGHSYPFIKQMTQSPLAFLPVELKDVNFSVPAPISFRHCYLKSFSYPGVTIAFFSL